MDGWQRIHIIGGPGSGKTRLAAELAARTGSPPHHLDNVARIGGGDGPLRAFDERDRMVADIVSGGRWVTEGVHLGWTRPLMEHADVIVWLDNVSWLTAARRISRRFAEGGVREARSRRGRQRVARFRDYGGHLRALGNAVLATRDYYLAPIPPGDGPQGRRRIAPEDTLGSRAATEALLAPYAHKVVHCRTSADIAALLEQVS